MPALRSRILLGIVALLAASGAQADASATRTATMPFKECLAIIAEASEESGEEAVQLVKTSDDLHTVRIDAADGFVTVSCSRLDNKMTLTKTGSTVTADLAKPQ